MQERQAVTLDDACSPSCQCPPVESKGKPSCGLQAFAPLIALQHPPSKSVERTSGYTIEVERVTNSIRLLTVKEPVQDRLICLRECVSKRRPPLALRFN